MGSRWAAQWRLPISPHIDIYLVLEALQSHVALEYRLTDHHRPSATVRRLVRTRGNNTWRPRHEATRQGPDLSSGRQPCTEPVRRCVR
eukprot:7384371-Prymnesium_polylepis.2